MKHRPPRRTGRQPTDTVTAVEAAAEVVAGVIAGRNAWAVWQVLTAEEPEHPGWARVRDWAWTALRDYGWGDAVLAAMAPRGVPARLRPMLLVAVSQLRPPDAPTHAIVDATVEAVKRLASHLAGFANALLRRFVRERERWLPEAMSDPVARWRHPRWWIGAWQQRYPDTWATLFELDNQPPPMGLRVRRAEETETVCAELEAAGIAAQKVDELPGALWLPQPVAWRQLPPAVQSAVVIQDLGAQWAAHFLAPQPGERVLDACAAPGGKALHLLDRAAVRLTALEADEERFAAMQQRFPELATQAVCRLAWHCAVQDWWDGVPFDAILLDAPCSATGVARRHPDVKWLRRAEDIAAFAQVQCELMEALWPTLRPGGRMLYVTCSLMPQENEYNVRTFLTRHDDAQWDEATSGQASPLLPTERHDGFFYALLRKR